MDIPIVEAYIGEYASGKSENAVNRALWLKNQGRKVTLADLDIVEPFYTLRPIKKKLEEMGIEVMAWESRKTMGLGETGNIIKPELRWVLKRPGDLILDVGYGVEGAKTLNLVHGAYDNPYLKIYAVINVSRPMTSTVPDIVEYIKYLGRVDGIINNTHLGDETDIEVIQNGAKIVNEASQELKIPVIFTSVEKHHQDILGNRDCAGNPVFYIQRFMSETFW
ncbi:MAG: ATP synthase [Desulfitibacter sp. BRH_c19]|nr:MAG: ATP synthase [Desulfitibacter sp. BRH_c19]